jgi:hypothetical protein
MPLRDAVEAVAQIEKQYRSSTVDRTIAAKLIGYSTLSGPANKALAALASYGLLERAGKGETRVTSRARAILHANNDDERRENLLAAASEPDLFRELRERFDGIPVPPEDGVITYLNRQGFNPTAVRPAAKAFIQTMAYVEELLARRPTSSPTNAGETHKGFGGAKVGDLIQWEARGVLQLEKPMRVREVSQDGQWVAVEGSQTGIPMNEVLVQEQASNQDKTPPVFPLASEDNTVKGEIEWMRSRLSANTHVRLLATGEMGPKEVGKLIKLLNAQKSVLEDDDVSEE